MSRNGQVGSVEYLVWKSFGHESGSARDRAMFTAASPQSQPSQVVKVASRNVPTPGTRVDSRMQAMRRRYPPMIPGRFDDGPSEGPGK